MKIAIVTGASSGLGREFVKIIYAQMTELDAIWVIARREERLIELKSQLGDKIKPIVLDLSELQAIHILEEKLKTESAEIACLVNCAGYSKFGQFGDITYASQMGMITLNCESLTRLTYIALPHVIKGAKIINVASSTAFFPQPNFAVYGATKSYVLSFSRALNKELKTKGISVTAVCPGPIQTEFFEVAETDVKMGYIAKLKRAHPKDVALKAYKDAAKHKDMSTYSASIVALKILTKLLPHRFFMNVLSDKEV